LGPGSREQNLDSKRHEAVARSLLRANIAEYWLIDARKDKIDFQILIHGASGTSPRKKKAGGKDP